MTGVPATTTFALRANAPLEKATPLLERFAQLGFEIAAAETARNKAIADNDANNLGGGGTTAAGIRAAAAAELAWALSTFPGLPVTLGGCPPINNNATGATVEA